MIKVCTKRDTNIAAIERKIGTRPDSMGRRRKKGVRSVVMEYETPLALYEIFIKQALKGAPEMIAYALAFPGRKGKKEVDVKKMVDLWAEMIPALATAHDADARDKAESMVDDMLTPMLTAPVKQLREFYKELITRLKADPRVPFLIWRSFEYWHEQFVSSAPDEAVKTLKRGLATQITDMVEQDVRPDIREAMIRALMWRDPAQLREMKEAVTEAKAEGVKPRVKGRQSCLFLQVQLNGREEPTEIML